MLIEQVELEQALALQVCAIHTLLLLQQIGNIGCLDLLSELLLLLLLLLLLSLCCLRRLRRNLLLGVRLLCRALSRSLVLRWSVYPWTWLNLWLLLIRLLRLTRLLLRWLLRLLGLRLLLLLLWLPRPSLLRLGLGLGLGLSCLNCRRLLGVSLLRMKSGQLSLHGDAWALGVDRVLAGVVSLLGHLLLLLLLKLLLLLLLLHRQLLGYEIGLYIPLASSQLTTFRNGTLELLHSFPALRAVALPDAVASDGSLA